MNQLQNIEDVQHGLTNVTTDVSEVHPVYYDVPVDRFLRLERKSEYKPNSSLVDDQTIINYSSKTIAFENLVDDNKKRNAILGDAGCGKSVTLRRLVKKAANKKITSMKDQELVIFLEMKNLTEEEPMHIWEFITGAAGATLEMENKRSLFRWMLKNEKKVVFFFDGLDQYPYELADERPPIKDYYSKVTVKRVLRDMFACHLFKNSKMLFTSRQFAMKGLPEDCWPNHITNIGGLEKETAESLILEVGGEACLTYLKKENIPLLDMSSNPLYLTFAIATYNLKCRNCPHTQTGVILCIISNFFHCSHARISSAELIPKLCSLAFEGTLHRKVTFTSKDFINHGINPTEVGDIFVTLPDKSQTVVKNSIIRGDWAFYFMHQSLQEMFTALMITQNFSLIKHLSSDYFEVVERMIYGICCNPENRGYLDLLQGKYVIYTLEFTLHNNLFHRFKFLRYFKPV